MKTKWSLWPLSALIAAASTAACIALFVPCTQAKQASGKPLTAGDFKQAAPRGFGDRNNTEAQSMVWWHNHLFVGTDREAVCVSDFAVWDYVAAKVGEEFADTYLPYPPTDPDLSCAADGSDLAIQAEIWSWTPDDNTWTRVFQSPLALDNPGNGGTNPPRVKWQGKKLPYEIAIRGLAPFTEPDGTEALYAFGVNSGIMWDTTKLPPPRILRSTDGVTFTPIPQTPGTFLGDLPFTSDHTSYRSPVSFAGKLFVLCGAVFGNGNLIASADPSKGDNAWFLASPPGIQYYDLAVLDGWLYLGGFDMVNGISSGYTVLKTRAEGTPPYEFITVVPSGAYLTKMPSDSVVSMHEHRGRLYVGTDNFAEVIRLNPDDTWDLVVGAPRAVPLPDGSSDWRYPLSGLDAGWGHTLNVHAWSMADFEKNLYIGTYNASTASRLDPAAGPLATHMGAHLYRSNDGGWYYGAVTTTGFASASDPFGGIFDYGIRTMASTPFGLFVGTANDYFGLAVFRGTNRPPALLDPPDRVEIEPLKDGSALLSWKASPVVRQYQIWRAERNPIFIRDNGDIEALNTPTGSKFQDVYVGPYRQIGVNQQIGVSKVQAFVDSSVQPGQSYMYYMLAEGEDGKFSDQSNLTALPLLTPSVTFAQLLHEVDVLDKRQRYKNPVRRLTQVQNMILNAQRLAMSCQLPAAIGKLDPQKAYTEVLEPDATDLEILLAKLVRRLELFNRFPFQVISNEFCSQP